MSNKRLPRKRTRVWKKKKWPKWARHVYVYRVEVGTHKRSADLIETIRPERRDCHSIHPGGFRVCHRERTLDLLLVRIRDLRIRTEKASFDQICRQAKKLGLRMCPQETALQILRQWRMLPKYLRWPQKDFYRLTVVSKHVGIKHDNQNAFEILGARTPRIRHIDVYRRKHAREFTYDDWWAFELPQEEARPSRSSRRN